MLESWSSLGGAHRNYHCMLTHSAYKTIAYTMSVSAFLVVYYEYALGRWRSPARTPRATSRGTGSMTGQRKAQEERRVGSLPEARSELPFVARQNREARLAPFGFGVNLDPRTRVPPQWVAIVVCGFVGIIVIADP